MSIEDNFNRQNLIDNFDEQAYLNLYGDVATAVGDPNSAFSLASTADADGGWSNNWP